MGEDGTPGSGSRTDCHAAAHAARGASVSDDPTTKARRQTQPGAERLGHASPPTYATPRAENTIGLSSDFR